MTQNKFSGANEETTNGKRANQTPLAANIQEQANVTGNELTESEPTGNEPTGNEPKRQQLKQLLVGSPEAVKSAIYHFQLTGQAQIGEWSPLVPNPDNPEEVISILVRHITVQ